MNRAIFGDVGTYHVLWALLLFCICVFLGCVHIMHMRTRQHFVMTCAACVCTCSTDTKVPPTTKFAKWMAQHPPSAEEEDALTWGRVTGADTDQIDAGSGDVETDRHTAKEVVPTEAQGGGADGGEVGRCGKGREPNTLEEIAEFKNKEALRLKVPWGLACVLVCNTCRVSERIGSLIALRCFA